MRTALGKLRLARGERVAPLGKRRLARDQRRLGGLLPAAVRRTVVCASPSLGELRELFLQVGVACVEPRAQRRRFGPRSLELGLVRAGLCP